MDRAPPFPPSLSMYVQDLYANMPYQSWEIVSHGPNHTLFTIVGGMVEVSVEIKVRET